MNNNSLFTNNIPSKWFHNLFILPLLLFSILIVSQLSGVLLSEVLPLPEPYQTAVYTLSIGFGVAIALTFALARFAEKRPALSIGLQSTAFLKQFFQGLLLGIAYFSLIVIAAIALGGIRLQLNSDFNLSSLANITVMLVGFIIQGSSEEIVARGYMLQVTAKRYNVFWGILLSSLFFSVLHAANPSLTLLPKLNLFLFAVFAALLSIAKKQIITICGFHAAWNWIQGNFYGIFVSGIDIPGGSVFRGTQLAGKDLISGGLFGLEGSILTTAAFIIGIVYYWLKINRSSPDRSKELKT